MIEFWTQFEGHLVEQSYRLLRCLSGGESTAVFLAESADGRSVAIRLVYAAPEAEELYLKGWESAAALNHPNLVRIFGSGRCALGEYTLLFVAMEAADEDLGQVLQGRALTAEEALDVLENVLKGLSHLHARGIVHGRVKPANILAVKDAIKLSTDGLGTPGTQGNAYAPPEAASQAISAAGDVWSLGISVFEMLTQRLPSGDEQESPAIPEPFRGVVSHCAAIDPQARWTVSQIAASLKPPAPEPVREPEPVLAPAEPQAQPAEPEAIPEAPRSGIDKRYLGIAAGFIAVLLAILLARKVMAPPPAPVNPPAQAKSAEMPVVPRPSAEVAARKKAAAAHETETVTGAWRVIVYTYAKREPAEKRARLINRKWPHLKAQVYTSAKLGRYYMVTIGGNLSQEEAKRLQRKARAMGLPRDSVARKL